MSSEIIPGCLFVGDREDSKFFKGVRICVIEGGPDAMVGPVAVGVLSGETHIPILEAVPNASSPKASRRALDEVADLIEVARHDHIPVLVRCGAGLERSPLAVMWYLRRQGMPLDQAFAIVKARRPQIFDRRDWLP